ENVRALVARLLVQGRKHGLPENLDGVLDTCAHGVDVGGCHTGNHDQTTSRYCSSTIWPSTMRTMRSVARPTAMSWVTMRKVNPFSRLSRRMSSTISSAFSLSRSPVGSSAHTIAGSLT